MDELLKKIHKFVKRITDANTLEQGDFLQQKLVMWLHEKQQPDAADWFEKWWTGSKGRWTSGHAGHANVRTNSSVEGHIGTCKNAWLGTGYRNCSMNSTEFFGAVLEDVKQRSIEHHNRLLNTPTGIASLKKFSIVDTDVINALKTLHPFCL